MEWILTHTAEIISLVTGIVAVASVVAKLTPTEIDNKVVGFLLKVIDLLALNTEPIKTK